MVSLWGFKQKAPKQICLEKKWPAWLTLARLQRLPVTWQLVASHHSQLHSQFASSLQQQSSHGFRVDCVAITTHNTSQVTTLSH